MVIEIHNNGKGASQYDDNDDDGGGERATIQVLATVRSRREVTH